MNGSRSIMRPSARISCCSRVTLMNTWWFPRLFFVTSSMSSLFTVIFFSMPALTTRAFRLPSLSSSNSSSKPSDASDSTDASASSSTRARFAAGSRFGFSRFGGSSFTGTLGISASHTTAPHPPVASNA